MQIFHSTFFFYNIDMFFSLLSTIFDFAVQKPGKHSIIMEGLWHVYQIYPTLYTWNHWQVYQIDQTLYLLWMRWDNCIYIFFNSVDGLIDCVEFYAVSAIFQPSLNWDNKSIYVLLISIYAGMNIQKPWLLLGNAVSNVAHGPHVRVH